MRRTVHAVCQRIVVLFLVSVLSVSIVVLCCHRADCIARASDVSGFSQNKLDVRNGPTSYRYIGHSPFPSCCNHNLTQNTTTTLFSAV